MSPTLAIEAVSKSFGRPVIDSLSLSVAPGEIYALLGPNGAGKTTTLRMIAGLLRADSGRITICGHDIAESPIAAKTHIAWLPDEPLLYDRLTPFEYLEFIAGLWRLPPATAATAADELLEMLGLWPHRNEPCEGFSRGMKQKTVLAGALIHNPQLFILDEPLTGLDAAAANLVKSILTARLKAGAAIILTTHILGTAERLADRIGILSGGVLRAEGNIAQLRIQAGQHSTASLEDIFLQLTLPLA